MIAGIASAWAGSLVGAITGPDGAPEPGALVVAYDARFRYLTATTDGDGRYRIDEVDPGTWRIRVLPAQASFLAERWIGDTQSACDADRLEVADGELRADLALLEGGAVMGRLVRGGPGGPPLAGATVRGLPTWHREIGAGTRTAVTAEDGSFAVTGLPGAPEGFDDTWRIEIGDGEVPGQFYLNAWTEDGATPIPGLPGEAVELGEVVAREGVTLEGRVMGPDGPVEEGTVSVTSSRLTLAAPIGPDGRWSVPAVFPGELLVWAVAPGFGRTFWPDADRPADRVFATEPGEVVADVDLTLPVESVVRGRIAGSGDLTRVGVALVNDDGTVAHSGSVEATGEFRFSGVRSGVWTLEVYGSAVGFVDGAIRDASGQRLPIEVGEAAEVDLGLVDVPRGATLRGRAVARGSGAPVYGAAVIADNSENPPVRRIAFTWTDGTWALEGLREGSWSVQIAYAPFCPGDPGWVGVHWPGVVDGDLGGRVDLSEGESFTWDPEVPPDADLDGMDDLWEVEHGLDPTVDDAALDPDGDGFTNRQEYRLGTDPNELVERRCGCAGTQVMLLLPGLWFGAWRRRPRDGEGDSPYGPRRPG